MTALVTTSRLVREWLTRLGLYFETSRDDREQIDREIERRYGVYCDDAIRMGLVKEDEFREIVDIILKRRKKKKVVHACMLNFFNCLGTEILHHGQTSRHMPHPVQISQSTAT